MEIAFVCPFGLSPKHTTSGRALPLAQALVQRGHHVRVLIPPWDHPADSGRRFEWNGVMVEHVTLPARVPGAAPAVVLWRLLRATVRLRPDVVHVFKPIGYSGFVALALWHLRRMGMVDARIVLDIDDWEGTGGWIDRSAYGALWRRALSWQERCGLTHCDAVTAASRTLQTLAWALGANCVRHVPNGLTSLPPGVPRKSARSQLGLDEREPVVLVYTRFVEVGPRHLAGLLGSLAEQAPSVHVVVVGRGLRDELPCLQARLNTRVQGGRVRLEGWIEQAELPLYWSAADFALYACEDNLLCRSKSPLRLVEMMGAGLPIVAHGVGEVNCYLEDCVSGLIAPPGNDAAFVEAAVRLASDDTLRARLGENARSRVTERFLWRSLVETVDGLYDTL